MKRLFRLIAERKEHISEIQKLSEHDCLKNMMCVTVESIWRKFVNEVLGITDITISIYPSFGLIEQFDEWLNEDIK